MRTWAKQVCTAAIILTSVFATHGQVRRWQPPDKSFSVEVPVDLEKEENGPGEASDPNAVTPYIGGSGKIAFRLVIFKYSRVSNEKFKDKFAGWWSLIGGDDDYDFVLSDTNVNGLSAVKVAYKKQRAEGMLIDGGAVVYVLGVAAKTKADFDSEVAKRYFNSFRLARPPR